VLLCFSSLPVSRIIPALRGLSKKKPFLLVTKSSPPSGGLRKKNMFVTPVFYLGAVKNGWTTALQYSSCKLANLVPKVLSGPIGLNDSLATGGCLKHLFFFPNRPKQCYKHCFLSGLKCFAPCCACCACCLAVRQVSLRRGETKETNAARCAYVYCTYL
jgi:hypothetical protein